MNHTASDHKSAARRRTEHQILEVAKPLFAQHGYGGVSVDRIALAADMSKQALLYYFPTKKQLYCAVLNGVLDVWLTYLEGMGRHPQDPEKALREYIAGKLRFSREHPDGSRVFASEVIAGAPHFGDEIARRVIPALQADEATYKHWVALGLCRPMDTRHLMVVLWAATQAYADFASQICLVLGKRKLSRKDFTDAEKVICDMVLRTVLVSAHDRPEAGNDISPQTT